MPKICVAGHVPFLPFPILLVIYLFSFENSKHSVQFNIVASFWEIITAHK